VKISVTTHPFGDPNDMPKKQLKGHEVHYNDVGRKYTKEEVRERLLKIQPEVIIAGTEKYDEDLIDQLTNLKMISRVGIGLDSVPLEKCQNECIIVTYTPDAPSNAVAELTICQMLNMLRKVQIADKDMRSGKWNRYVGSEIRSCEIGVIGCGRIGNLVIDKLQGLKPRRIFANDIVGEKAHGLPRTEYATKMQILSNCDIITIHIPSNEENNGYLSKTDFELMKKDVKLINMSRGGIINESDLYDFLKSNPESRAAIDTFDSEPYDGDLLSLENAFLTPHLGSCSKKSRFDMEMGAVEEVINFIKNKQFFNRVV
jgi:D-3-phosphoglycerate dehydrogenase